MNYDITYTFYDTISKNFILFFVILIIAVNFVPIFLFNKNQDFRAYFYKMDDKQKPFGMAWLSSSYYETLFATTPWQNVIYRTR